MAMALSSARRQKERDLSETLYDVDADAKARNEKRKYNVTM
jgi:hypothetical protein